MEQQWNVRSFGYTLNSVKGSKDDRVYLETRFNVITFEITSTHSHNSFLRYVTRFMSSCPKRLIYKLGMPQHEMSRRFHRRVVIPFENSQVFGLFLVEKRLVLDCRLHFWAGTVSKMPPASFGID